MNNKVVQIFIFVALAAVGLFLMDRFLSDTESNEPVKKSATIAKSASTTAIKAEKAQNDASFERVKVLADDMAAERAKAAENQDELEKQIVDLEADKLLQWAKAQRKKASLPGMTFVGMIKTCREIIKKYPNTNYARQAKELLRQVPEYRRRTYEITDEELGL